jgi:hypothetical protein
MKLINPVLWCILLSNVFAYSLPVEYTFAGTVSSVGVFNMETYEMETTYPELRGVATSQEVSYQFIIDLDAIGYFMDENDRVDVPNYYYSSTNSVDPENIITDEYIYRFFESDMLGRELFFVPGDQNRTRHHSFIAEHEQSVNGSSILTEQTGTLCSNGAGHETQIWRDGSPSSWSVGMSLTGVEFFNLDDVHFDCANTILTHTSIRSIADDEPLGVPEPSSSGLLLLGIGSLLARGCIRRPSKSFESV